MKPLKIFKLTKSIISASFVIMLIFNLGCSRSMLAPDAQLWSAASSNPANPQTVSDTPQPAWLIPTHRPAGETPLAPTPDAPHILPTLRTQTEIYTVVGGDTLAKIARRYGVSVRLVAEANNLENPNLLEIGQVLIVPPPQPEGIGSDFKIIPDSELVYGPASVDFDVNGFVEYHNGYLSHYWEEVNGRSLSGAQIITNIAQDYSVNPRLLLAILQYQGGWLVNKNPEKTIQDYPIGVRDPQRMGLYRQLSWAANNLNRGYYLWKANAIATWSLTDDVLLHASPLINAGTAGVQQFFALLYDRANWETAVSPAGFFTTYDALFGYPFDYAIEPNLPAGLTQPPMQLPFEPNLEWAFTSGPHGGWGDGSAWAALDFAPPGDIPGCVLSDEWVTAVADGLILRAQDGAVMQDLDGDGLEQTGWVILYMHIESRDRVEPGTFLKAGEKIGHPSCEGGVSTGTHVHLARRYNGEWISADQQIPFNLDGWISSGTGNEYDGYLHRNTVSIEAYAGRSDYNILQR